MTRRFTTTPRCAARNLPNTKTNKKHFLLTFERRLKENASLYFCMRQNCRNTWGSQWLKGSQWPEDNTRVKQPFTAEWDWADAIIKSIGMFITLDMRQYFVMENKGFENMMKVLKPRYKIPSLTHFSMKIMPDHYEQGKNQNARWIIQGILCCPHHRQVDLHGNGKPLDCKCSLHHKGVGDAKSSAAVTLPLWEAYRHK